MPKMASWATEEGGQEARDIGGVSTKISRMDPFAKNATPTDIDVKFIKREESTDDKADVLTAWIEIDGIPNNQTEAHVACVKIEENEIQTHGDQTKIKSSPDSWNSRETVLTTEKYNRHVDGTVDAQTESDLSYKCDACTGQFNDKLIFKEHIKSVHTAVTSDYTITKCIVNDSSIAIPVIQDSQPSTSNGIRSDYNSPPSSYVSYDSQTLPSDSVSSLFESNTQLCSSKTVPKYSILNRGDSTEKYQPFLGISYAGDDSACTKKRAIDHTIKNTRGIYSNSSDLSSDISSDCKASDKCGLNKHLKIHANKEESSFDYFNKESKQCGAPSKLIGQYVGPGQRHYECSVCGYKSAKRAHFKRHILTHMGHKPYTCRFCDYKCAQSSNLKRHMVTHTGDTPYKCNLCDYKCAQSSSLKRHMWTHKGDMPYKCDKCFFKCSQKIHLKAHILTHTGDKPYKCQLCDYKCAHSSNLKRHNILKHTGDKPYKCNLCDYKCAQGSSLKRHMWTHTEDKPYTCQLCDYKCAQSSNLKKHNMVAHTGDTYKCNLCDYECAQGSRLNKHMRTHKGYMPYKCEKCNYKCAQKSHLKTHILTHTGDKPYKCQFCDYKSIQNYNLKRHIMVKHTGDMPYKCNLCDYKCAQGSSLKRHMWTHEGDMPYKCDKCNYKSAQSSHLKRHRLTCVASNVHIVLS